ncbi:MAG: alkene reductase [Candidatus Eisenbacteria bacterium]
MTRTISMFAPFHLGAIALNNRIAMAPMTRNRSGEERIPGELTLRYYVQRATAGVIITEATQVHPTGVGYLATPGIHNAEQVAAWRRITDAVHSEGGRIVLQLWHVGRISHTSLQPDGQAPIAPSAITAQGDAYTMEGPQPFSTPRELGIEEIRDVVGQFAHGARNALRAGFDGVEVHAANGYLIDQFLRDGSNRRTDAYGGSPENRARFLLEVVDAVVGVWGAGHVGVRLSPLNPYNDMHDSDPFTTFTVAAEGLSKFGLAYLHVIEPASTADDGPSQRITPVLHRAFGGIIMANGGYTRALAQAVIASGEADIVSFGTPFVSNPDLVERFESGADLAAPDPATFYTGGAKGYTDYAALTPAS